jgi:hypothetical protein
VFTDATEGVQVGVIGALREVLMLFIQHFRRGSELDG